MDKIMYQFNDEEPKLLGAVENGKDFTITFTTDTNQVSDPWRAGMYSLEFKAEDGSTLKVYREDEK
jgi:hypothetical protein